MQHRSRRVFDARLLAFPVLFIGLGVWAENPDIFSNIEHDLGLTRHSSVVAPVDEAEVAKRYPLLALEVE